MNSEIAGKIMSAVMGFEEVNAAVAKELNPTRSGIPVHKVEFTAWETYQIELDHRKYVGTNSD